MLKPSEHPQLIADRLYRFDQFASHRVRTIDDVTEDNIRTYHELGYLAIDEVFSGEEIRAGLQDIADVIHGRIAGPHIQYRQKVGEFGQTDDVPTPEGREFAVRKLHKFVEYCPSLHHMCFYPKIWNLLERIFDEPPVFSHQDQALLKPPSPNAGIEKPWHQDMAYRNFAYNKLVAGVWIALDEAAPDNGCMHIIPRSHRNGPVPHYAVRDWQLCDVAVDVQRDEIVPLQPGGMLVFNGLLHHGTPPNLSARQRRALQFHYAPQSAEKLTPREYKLIFTNEMTHADC